MDVAILIYEGFTALDVTGPFEVLSRLPEAKVRFVAADAGVCPADQPGFGLNAAPLSATASPDIIVVSGGSTTQQHLGDQRLLDWLRTAHDTSTWTTSVCTGSMLLGAAGLLRGLRATTHWYELESLRCFDAIPSTDRVVIDGKVVTAAGVSSGIDMALRVCDLLHGPEFAQMVQLGIEYDPQPPYDAGSLVKAPAEVAAQAREIMERYYGPSWAERESGRQAGR